MRLALAHKGNVNESSAFQRFFLEWDKFISSCPSNLVFDAIARRIAFIKQEANDFEAAFGGMLDAPFREEFHCLSDVIFVLRHTDHSKLASLGVRRGSRRMADDNRRPEHPVCHNAHQ